MPHNHEHPPPVDKQTLDIVQYFVRTRPARLQKALAKAKSQARGILRWLFADEKNALSAQTFRCVNCFATDLKKEIASDPWQKKRLEDAINDYWSNRRWGPLGSTKMRPRNSQFRQQHSQRRPNSDQNTTKRQHQGFYKL
ncbi:hypothetical protein LEL_10530 [Akanthomyces lecanii RCEF 1005]|uniref:Uncharacterized protein n=1 Tax=Akanthomyces lecanii RCEF 1005 TaxID=1081108 RepID=A0A167XKF5_CORDF|nr:hypothetical protein LEL_10530 [Akanthomyces lecanii RCEF 1005]